MNLTKGTHSVFVSDSIQYGRLKLHTVIWHVKASALPGSHQERSPALSSGQVMPKVNSSPVSTADKNHPLAALSGWVTCILRKDSAYLES